jgi:glycerol uptake facilitator-like aquaporin
MIETSHQAAKKERDYPPYFDSLTLKKIFWFEAVGAFILSVGATSCSYSTLNDICIPNIVFWVNVLSGPFTGAHLNAMITLSWVFKSNKPFKLPALFVVVYILSQIFGAMCGGIALYFLHSKCHTTKMARLD